MLSLMGAVIMGSADGDPEDGAAVYDPCSENSDATYRSPPADDLITNGEGAGAIGIC